MDKELQDKLFENYPYLFSNKDKKPFESCMSFGIECGNGWYEIISSLCYEINQHEEQLKSRKERGKESEKDLEYNKVKFDQVKEKFGGLRVYFDGGDDYVSGLVSMAEAVSYKVCEVCGNKGRANEKGWISTLCEDCRKLNRFKN